MPLYNNPAITNNKFAISVLNSTQGDLTKGFSIIGPFETVDAAAQWAEVYITNTHYDTPFWNVIEMSAP